MSLKFSRRCRRLLAGDPLRGKKSRLRAASYISGDRKRHTWQCVARDLTVVYPDAGCAIGISPIAGEKIPIKELNDDTGELRFNSQGGDVSLFYESGTLTVTQS